MTDIKGEIHKGNLHFHRITTNRSCTYYSMHVCIKVNITESNPTDIS